MSRTTNITMVHAAKIASLGYPGCKTVQGVASFCRKNKKSVNCVWWKNNNKNILFVDPNSFKQCYKAIASAKKIVGRTTKWTSRTGTTTKIHGNRMWRKGTRRVTKRRRAA